MTRMSYGEARDTILDHTEIGYTIASQDRLWTVFIFDLWGAEGDPYRYNRLYPLPSGAWSYEVGIGSGEKVWFYTTRVEAEAAAEELREGLRKSYDHASASGEIPGPPTPPEVYVINWGDDARYEASIIGRDSGARTRTTPKFKGSERAWAAMVEMSRRWLGRNGG